MDKEELDLGLVMKCVESHIASFSPPQAKMPYKSIQGMWFDVPHRQFFNFSRLGCLEKAFKACKLSSVAI